MTTTTAAGVILQLPPGWQVEPDLAARIGVDLVALAPGAGAFRTNAVLSSSTVPDSTLEQWADITDSLLEATVDRYLLVDRWVDEHPEPTSRRIASYRTAEGVDVTLLQWCLLRETRGITLSLTCATADYPVLADELRAIGAGLRREKA